MGAWPTVGDFATWADFGQVADNNGEPNPVLVKSLAAATSQIRSLLDERLLPEDTDECPDDVHLAILMQANRLSSRKDSPMGTLGAAEALIQIRADDPDVLRLIAAYRTPDILPI